MKKAGRLAAAVFAAMLLVTGCGAPAEKKAVETTPEQSSKIEQKEEAKNLKDAFKKDFKVGVAINPYQLKDEETKKIILENFNSITMENGMKPEAILDQRASENSKDGMPAINEENLEECLSLAKDNGLVLRGHCLVWHNQTPEWFFCEKYDAGNAKVNKETMKKRMESDLLLKIISVVFAFLLWMFVINTDNPVIKKTFSDVPVDMLNEQVLDDLNQTYKIESGDTVSFTVKGKKDVVDRLTKSDFRATADVSSMSDVHAIQIEVEALRYKSQLDIDTGGATVKVVLEDVKSDQIPVNVVVKGTPASGYTVSTQTATPNLISVSGPKSVVSRIKQIVAKVDVSGLKKDVTMAQNVKCYDEDGDEVSQDRIKLDTTKIKVKIGLSRTKTIPFTVETKGTPGKGYVLGSIDYEPKHIEITGAEDDLEKISSIKLANLDISDSTKSIEKTIKASDIKLPDGITFVKSVDKIKNIVIRANIEKKTKRTLTIPTEQIALINNTKNYDVKFDDSELKVKISGLRSVVDKVVVKDLNPKIDMQLYEPGTHTVQVQLTKIKNMSIEKNVSAKITVE